jgi:hypothetical protein
MAVRSSALRACRPLPPGRFLDLISVKGWVDLRVIVRLERLGSLKNLVTSSGIEPRPSGLQHSASTNYVIIYTTCVILTTWKQCSPKRQSRSLAVFVTPYFPLYARQWTYMSFITKLEIMMPFNIGLNPCTYINRQTEYHKTFFAFKETQNLYVHQHFFIDFFILAVLSNLCYVYKKVKYPFIQCSF